tara:strand:- start:216 stop:452 length:237 start_codon:yes stop_codon:yes gene_type:complete
MMNIDQFLAALSNFQQTNQPKPQAPMQYQDDQEYKPYYEEMMNPPAGIPQGQMGRHQVTGIDEILRRLYSPQSMQASR